MKIKMSFFFLMFITLLQAQEKAPEVLTFEEYIAFVKRYHPVAKQAELQISKGEANLLKARGGFDPKIEVDYDRKEFKGTEYYNILNSTFKIPIWYGLELKAGFEQNEGYYLNPERTVPEEGQYSAGVSFNVGQGLFADERMNAIKSAKAFREQTIAERDIILNQVLFEAAVAYFDWMQAFNEYEIYKGFLKNAAERFQGVRQNALIGEIPTIDTVEAKISLQDRTLQLEQAAVKLMKERTDLSNFLWMENNVPVELQLVIIPERNILGEVDLVLEVSQNFISYFSFDNHPKLQSLRAKLKALELERRLKANNLLPEINLDYNFITSKPDVYNTFNTSNYKAGLRFSFPIFLRKQRGELQLTDLKVQNLEFYINLNERQIENKLMAIGKELKSYETQIAIIEAMIENYRTLLAAELRKFSYGESSLFLINSRESKLIEAQLKQNEVFTKFLYAKAEFFKSLGAIPKLN